MLSATAPRLVAVATCLVLLSGCSTAADAGGQPLTTHDLLLTATPAGFTSKVDTALTVDTASSTLATDPTPTRAQLTSLGYADGAEKVWVSGSEYAVDLVFAFNSTVGSGSMVAFVRSQLRSRPAVTLFDDGDVPGAQAYDEYAMTRAGGRQVFCETALFPLDRYMFEVEDCADGPHYAAGPLTMTRDQYVRAANLLGLPVLSPTAAPSPTPTVPAPSST